MRKFLKMKWILFSQKITEKVNILLVQQINIERGKRMKKWFSFLMIGFIALCLDMMVGNCFAATDFVGTAGSSSISGVTPATVNLTAYEGKAFYLTKVIASTDLSGSMLSIYKANATGVTNNFTLINKYPVPTTGLYLLGDKVNPLFVGADFTKYRFTVDGTSTNYLIIDGFFDTYKGIRQ